MGANGSVPATTAPIPQYPPNQGYQGPQGYGAPPQAQPNVYYRGAPPQPMNGGYGPPPGMYGPPPPRGRYPPIPPPGSNRPPPVRLGDRNYMSGPPGGQPGPQGGPPAGLQPRDNYPPEIKRILEDDDDDFFSDDVDDFLNAGKKRHDFSTGAGVEQFVFSKMTKNQLQPDVGPRYYSRPPPGGQRGGGYGEVQPSRAPQYNAQPQIIHLQPQDGQRYQLDYDHQTGRINFGDAPGVREIAGYRVNDRSSFPFSFGSSNGGY